MSPTYCIIGILLASQGLPSPKHSGKICCHQRTNHTFKPNLFVHKFSRNITFHCIYLKAYLKLYENYSSSWIVFIAIASVQIYNSLRKMV